MRPIIAAIFLPFAACATIIDGGPDAISYDTNPPGATVYLDGASVGQTPCTVIADRSLKGEIRLELEGYRVEHDRLDSVVNAWFLGNFIWVPGLVGVFGIIIDVASGDVTKWNERTRRFDLEPIADE